MKKIIVGTFIILTTITNAISFTVYPTRFEIDSKSVGIYEAEVVNNTEEPLRVTMYTEEDDNFGKEYNINENIVVVPKNIALKPGASQTVRFRFKPDKNKTDGEYKSNIIFKEIPLDIKSVSKAENNENMTSNVRFITEMAIPVYALGDNLIREGELKNIKINIQGSVMNIEAQTVSKGNSKIEFSYSIKEVNGSYKTDGILGYSLRNGESKISTSIPLEEKLKGKKLEIKIYDTQKEYYKNKVNF
ncbi:fimbria/pilus periplasmic chaperone [Fusobacterium mortiferum]|uniref:Molecular chaperone n=1 Tax=Fusobacterium mortiferum TaxID=850 RepID=A0ABS2G2T4_FUSMR|nr:fimbria/pilus periplasmic chaperone [Fusobacterium mortiferum]MBM6875726.1 molecular chaperone [Fusobacterium mortiferum]